MAAYQFSSPQAVREAFAAIELPTALSRKGLLRGVDVFEPELAERVATLNLRENTVYWEDEDGFQNYGAWFQIEDYFVEVRLIAFASVVADDPAISPSLSADEQATLYGQLLSQKFAQNVPFNQLVNRDRAKWLGKRLLNMTLKQLLNVAPIKGSRDQVGAEASARSSASPSQGIIPDWYGSGVQAQTWTHQTSSGASCSPLSFAEDCHHLATWNQPYGNGAHFIGNGGDNATCQYSGSNGCISGWTWWLLSPISRLGVPKTFYFSWVGGGSMNCSNYTASVWFE